MLAQVRATIRKYSMLAAGDRILAGVSGGPDSVVMVHILQRLAGELQLEILVAHLDHGFRGRESQVDAEFVRDLAGKLGLQSVIRQVDAAGYARKKNLSAQMAARELRYLFFEEAAREFNCVKLATGHNANDQAETVLFNFLRGSGVAGLGGIPPVRDGWVIRPLIEISRSDIEEYCRQNDLVPRIDRSNLKSIYTRNRIRLELIPLLEREYNPNMVETLVRTGEILREDERCLEKAARGCWDQVYIGKDCKSLVFDQARFGELDPALQRRVIRRAWEELTGPGHSLEFVHLQQIMKTAVEGQTGAVLNLPGGIIFIKSYGTFSLARETAGPAASFTYELKVPGETPIPEVGAVISAELIDVTGDIPTKSDEIAVDLEKVALPLRVRCRRPGDWFEPLGLNGSKKLKKYLIDKKIPRRDRENLPIVVTADDQIIWVAGLRADGRWQAGPKTRRVLRLKIIRNI